VFWKTIKKSFADAYGYLGLTVLCSIIVFGIIPAGCGILYLLKIKDPYIWTIMVLFLYIFAVSPFLAGAHYMARKMVTNDEPSASDLFRGAKEFLFPSWALGAVQVVFTFVVFAGMWFYFTRGTLPLKLVGLVILYVLIFWALSTIYHFPILIEQRPGALKTIKRGFLLLMGSPGFTVSIFLVIILLAFIGIASTIGLPLLFFGIISIIQIRALRVQFMKYGLIESEPEPVTGDSSGADDWPVGL
jgi:hypothetical protein